MKTMVGLLNNYIQTSWGLEHVQNYGLVKNWFGNENFTIMGKVVKIFGLCLRCSIENSRELLKIALILMFLKLEFL